MPKALSRPRIADAPPDSPPSAIHPLRLPHAWMPSLRLVMNSRYTRSYSRWPSLYYLILSANRFGTSVSTVPLSSGIDNLLQ